MRSLDRLDIEVHSAFVLSDGGVPRVGERARRAIAETGNIVLVPAEVLSVCFGLVATVAMVDDLQAPAESITQRPGAAQPNYCALILSAVV